MNYNNFYKDCMASSIVRAIPLDFSDAIIQEIYMEATSGDIHTKPQYLYTLALRRVQDRCRNLLSGRKVTLKYLDEVLFLEEPTSELKDWCGGCCYQEDFTYTETPQVSSETLGAAIAKLSSQQSRHYNALAKELLPSCNSDVQALFLEANAIAERLRYKKKHKK